MIGVKAGFHFIIINNKGFVIIIIANWGGLNEPLPYRQTVSEIPLEIICLESNVSCQKHKL